jgi:hypothetical protein
MSGCVDEWLDTFHIISREEMVRRGEGLASRAVSVFDSLDGMRSGCPFG